MQCTYHRHFSLHPGPYRPSEHPAELGSPSHSLCPQFSPVNPAAHLHCPVRPSQKPPFSQEHSWAQLKKLDVGCEKKTYFSPNLFGGQGVSHRVPMKPGGQRQAPVRCSQSPPFSLMLLEEKRTHHWQVSLQSTPKRPVTQPLLQSSPV